MRKRKPPINRGSSSQISPQATLIRLGWTPDKKYWISPYFGSRMELETALSLEHNITLMNLSRRHNP